MRTRGLELPWGLRSPHATGPTRLEVGPQDSVPAAIIAGRRSGGKSDTYIDVGGIHVSLTGSGNTEQDAERLAMLVERRIEESFRNGRLRVLAQRATGTRGGYS